MVKEIYAEPRFVDDLSECYFYHTMDIPGYGCVRGEWDLRGKEAELLGGVDFRGKRVLEIGTASGFLCFYMERQGAEVVACDVSERQAWDTMPLAKYDSSEFDRLLQDRKKSIRMLNIASGWQAGPMDPRLGSFTVLRTKSHRK
jgi:protein-L-isoaspartate O-methyltransferase